MTQTQSCGASPESWEHFYKLVGEDLLPVAANLRASISPGSKLKPQNRGKVPSWYNHQREISGIPDWTNVRASADVLERWAKDPELGICIVTRKVRGIDVDVEDPALSALVRALIEKHFGKLPIRSRPNSSKFLAALTLPGDYKKRRLRVGEEAFVEFLANGQQFIADSTHQSGVRYEWEGGLPPSFPICTAEAFEAFWADLESQYSIRPAPKAESTASTLAPTATTPSAGIHEGWRNEYLFKEGCALRGRGWSTAAIAAAIHAANVEQCVPPLDDAEVSTIAESVGRYEQGIQPKTPRRLRAEPVGLAALNGIAAEPQQIVDQLILQDACGFVAPGGTGKTTLAMFEAIHIILGRPLWGREILKSGGVAFISAEDSCAMLESRLIQIVDELELTANERETVAQNFHIEDLSLEDARLLTVDPKGHVQATGLVDEIVESYINKSVSLIHLDPASLMGPGEQSGNDGMAGLMRSARQISMRTLACCQIVHHVSQSVARGGVQDQYAGRGGTAFADNSRGNRQLVRIEDREYEFKNNWYCMPEWITEEDLSRGRVLAMLVHKLSYVELIPYPIFIFRRGFSYMQFHAMPLGKRKNAKKTLDEKVEAVVGFLTKAMANGRMFTATAVADRHHNEYGLNRADARTAVEAGLAGGDNSRLVLLPLPPEAKRKGSLKDFLGVRNTSKSDSVEL